MRKQLVGTAVLIIGLAAGQAEAAGAERSKAGVTPDGTVIEAITLSNASGVSARILSYGATLQSVIAPDREGKMADVLLGYDDAASYVSKPSYFGVTVGRYANRIGGGKFELDGKRFQIALNDKTNTLHGGSRGFDKVMWRVVSVKERPLPSVTLAYKSPDGDQGYPGTLDVTTTYSLDDKGNLSIEFNAKTDKATVVNMTNHAFFNLAGEGSPAGALGLKLTIPASAYTPVDATLIPTGELRPVAGTDFDFRSPRTISEAIRDGHDQQIVYGRGYDHNFALDAGLTSTPKLAAKLEDPISGRVLEVLSTEPGLQLYTGNFLDGTVIGKKGHVYRMGDAIILEPQKFPDAPNKSNFISARVDPGKPYHHLMILHFTTAKPN